MSPSYQNRTAPSRVKLFEIQHTSQETDNCRVKFESVMDAGDDGRCLTRGENGKEGGESPEKSEDLFLLCAQLSRKMMAARKQKLVPDERTELQTLHASLVAGGMALRTGQEQRAENLLSKTAEMFQTWSEMVEQRQINAAREKQANVAKWMYRIKLSAVIVASVLGVSLLVLGGAWAWYWVEEKLDIDKMERIAKTVPPKRIRLPDGTTMEFVWCPPGRFKMGSPFWEEKRDKDETRHPVALTKGFWIGKKKISQNQWKCVMGTAFAQQRGKAFAEYSRQTARAQRTINLEELFATRNEVEGKDAPMPYVNWDECQEFCQRLSGIIGMTVRLPTEAEWEYACRAGRHGLFGEQRDYPNALGVEDMTMLTREWCADWYGDYPDTLAIDPEGPTNGEKRVCRGGWSSGGLFSREDLRHSTNYFARSAARDSLPPTYRGSWIGFRVCLVADDDETDMQIQKR